MTVIIRLQNLPWSANALDIRRFFQGLSIPDGGVHIVGGEKGDAFIAFSTDDDARQAMYMDGGRVHDAPIKLLLSSKTEMQNVISIARGSAPPGPSTTGPNDSNRPPPSGGAPGPPGGMMAPGFPERGMHNMSSGNQQFGPSGPNRPGNHSMRDNRGMGRGGNPGFSPNQGNQFDRGVGHPNRGGQNFERMRPMEETGGGPQQPIGDVPQLNDNFESHSMEGHHGGRAPGHMEGGPEWNERNNGNRMSGGNDRGRGRYERGRSQRAPMGMASNRVGGQFDRGSELEESGPAPRRMDRFQRSGSAGSSRMENRGQIAGTGDRMGDFDGDRENHQEQYDDGYIGNRERTHDEWDNGDGFRNYQGPNRFGRNEEMDGFRESQNVDRFRRNENDRFGETDSGDNRHRADHFTSDHRRPQRFADRKEYEGHNDRTRAYDQEYNYQDREMEDTWEHPDQPYHDSRMPRQDIPDMRQMPVDNPNYHDRDSGYDIDNTFEEPGDRFERQEMFDQEGYDDPDSFREFRRQEFQQGDFEEMDYQRDDFSRAHTRENQDQRFQERGFHGHNVERRGFGSRMRGMGRGGRMESRKRERDQHVYAFVSCMPHTVSYKDVRRFFSGCEIPHDGLKLINDKQGNRDGTAYVKFAKELDCYHALKRSGQIGMGTNRIHVARCHQADFENAIDSYVPGSTGKQSRAYSPPTKRNRSRSPVSRGSHDGSNCVIMHNVNYHATRLDIRQFLGSCKIKENGGPHIELGKDGRPTGVACVELDSKSDFDEALKQSKRTFMRRPVEIVPITKKEFEKIVQNNDGVSGDKRQVEIKDETREKEKKEDRSDPTSSGSKSDEKKYFCVKMRGLPFSSTPNDVREFFSGLGIANRGLNVLTNRQGQATGMAYVEFVTSTDCKKALEKDKHYMGKRYIDIIPITKIDMLDEISMEQQKTSGGSNSGRGPPLKRVPDLPGVNRPGSTITMSNLPYKVQLEDIMTFLSSCRPIQDSVRLRYSKDGKPTGDAMVAFQNSNDAQRAIHELNHQMMMGRAVALALAP